MGVAMRRIEGQAAAFLVARATPLFFAGLIFALLAITGFSQLELRNDYRAFFDRDDPILAITDRLAARMGDSKETAIIIYRPGDKNALTTLSLLQYGQLSDRAKGLPNVIKAKTWMDAEKIVDLPRKDVSGRPAMALIPYPQGADFFSAEGTAVLKRDIARTPTIYGRYIARDFSSATVMLQIDLETGKGSRVEKLRHLEGQIAKLEADLQKAAPNDRLLLVGSTLFDYASTSILLEDVKRLFPIAALVVVATLFLLYRSVSFTLWSMVLILLPVAATGGIVAASGTPFSTLTVSALMLVGTLAVADVVHLANSFFLISETERNKATALTQAIEKNFWAITATSSTTAIGEIALLFSAAPPVRVMGYTVIVGVLVAWALAVMMLPYVLLGTRSSHRTGASFLSAPLARISIACARRPGLVLGGFGALLLVCGYGAGLGRIDDSMSAWFSKETRFRQGMDILDAQYLGLRTMTLATRVLDGDRAIADSPREESLVKAGYSTLQERLSGASSGYWLSAVTAARAREERLAEKGETGFRPDPAILPEDPSPVTSRALSDAGLMTQYEPGKVDLAIWYFDPRGTTTFETLAAAARIEGVARVAAPEREPQVQGVSLAFASLSARNFHSMVSGSIVAFLVMTVSLAVVFGSWRMGMLSMIPNLAPLLVVYGVWGFIDGRINMAAVSVFSVACGIIVDDTIHIIMMFKRYRSQGRSVEEALGHAVEASGTGVLATTIVIAAGFFLLSLSHFSLTAQKAGMVGWAIMVACLFDLLAMPALLVVAERFRDWATPKALSEQMHRLASREWRW